MYNESFEILVQQQPAENHEQWFEAMANNLLRNYVIDTGMAIYRFMEIEFYYYSKEHPDEITYGFSRNHEKLPPRMKRLKKAQHQHLTWFFHYSGIDLVIGHEQNPGGILIRSLQRLDNGELLNGPFIVLLELLNQHVDIKGEKPLQLLLKRQDVSFDVSVKTKKRIGVNTGGYHDKLYNFNV